ncbi:hypothetical protein [Salinispora arenicola]|uniref:hypothetical protein n=1 Tax=Salinispora arenicola TaxID=168697 RepID=UPI0016A4FB84|nr:hypothetical protein [Salinispora arenicola]NIL59780.1 hypothetical protein [Salinispora arenicola]NIL64722.1 hypothetical protein [Salinispora arenicola]
MSHWELILSITLGLLVNEVTDISPAIARRLVRWSAYRWTTNPEIAARYAEEWTALINARPGKLLKILTGIRFSLGAAGRAAPRFARGRIKATRITILRIKASLTSVLRKDHPTQESQWSYHEISTDSPTKAEVWLKGEMRHIMKPVPLYLEGKGDLAQTITKAAMTVGDSDSVRVRVSECGDGCQCAPNPYYWDEERLPD